MRTIAVTSGKGGVGKTNIAANLGILFSGRGKRTVVFDADLGLANLDVVMGVRAPFTLQHVVTGEKGLLEVVCEGPRGVRFIAGGSGVEDLLNLTGPQLEGFLMELEGLTKTTDILIFDTGAGLDDKVMTFLRAADETLLVTTPDPASVTDAYATAKLLFMVKPDAVVRVVMNMVIDEAHAHAVFAKLNAICRQFSGKSMFYAGHVRHDPQVGFYIRKRVPFYGAQPRLKASMDLANVASRLLGEEPEGEETGLAERLRALFGFGLKKSA